jgi:hypothetical protein
MAETDLLGGRLPLLAPGDLAQGQQKELYQRMRTHQVPWADRHNFKAMTGGGRLIGPFNPLLYSPEGGTGFLDFEAAEERSSSQAPLQFRSAFTGVCAERVRAGRERGRGRRPRCAGARRAWRTGG